jgi:hypothetical protein
MGVGGHHGGSSLIPPTRLTFPVSSLSPPSLPHSHSLPSSLPDTSPPFILLSLLALPPPSSPDAQHVLGLFLRCWWWHAPQPRRARAPVPGWHALGWHAHDGSHADQPGRTPCCRVREMREGHRKVCKSKQKVDGGCRNTRGACSPSPSALSPSLIPDPSSLPHPSSLPSPLQLHHPLRREPLPLSHSRGKPAVRGRS